jgi:hypothetical protein
MNDPQNAWQNQPTEPFHMSADLLRYKAQQRQRKARLEATLSIAGGIVLSALFGLAACRAQQLLTGTGWAVLSIWCLYFAWQAYRWVLPPNLAPDAELGTSLEFYRTELEKRRDYGRHIWRRSGLIFCFLGLAMVVLPPMIQLRHNPRMLVNAAPFFTLLLIWFVVFFRQKKQKLHQLQQDIDELRAFERDRS